MTNYVKIRCRPKEQRNKEGHFRLHLLPHFGGKPMDRINARNIDDYIAAKRGTLAAKTINEHLSTLNLALRLAKKYGHIEHAPEIDWLTVERKERKHLSFDDAEKLIKAADGVPAQITLPLEGLKVSTSLPVVPISLIRGHPRPNPVTAPIGFAVVPEQ